LDTIFLPTVIPSEEVHSLGERTSQPRDLQVFHKTYYVYIMASRSLNLYTGVTNSVYRRTLQHKSGDIEGFTRRYNINRLVYYETFSHIGSAIAREKQIKSWTRAKRIALIKTKNPARQDFAEGWGQKFELQIPRRTG
jgi:putative endonuclease